MAAPAAVAETTETTTAGLAGEATLATEQDVMEAAHAGGSELQCETCGKAAPASLPANLARGWLKAHGRREHGEPGPTQKARGPGSQRPSPRARAPRDDSRPRPRPPGAPSLRQLEEQLATTYSLMALVLAPFRPMTAQALMESSPAIAHAWIVWAETNKTVERALLAATNATGPAAIIMAHAPVIRAIRVEQAMLAQQRAEAPPPGEAPPGFAPFAAANGAGAFAEAAPVGDGYPAS